MPVSDSAVRQKTLFCPCGQDLPAVAGLCRRCYGQAVRSRRFFAGLRAEILHRDGHRCRACAASGQLIVHHRVPRVNERELLVTLCAACHARLHRLLAVRRWIPEPLVPLWAEHHPGVPLQLQFPVGL